MSVKFLCATILCGALLATVPVALADSVRADWNHNLNFEQFHAYSWGKVKVSNPFDADRIEHAIDGQLHKKGWQEVPSGGQVTIDVADHIRNEQEAETYYSGLGGGWGMGWGWGGWGWSGWGWGPGGFGQSETTMKNVPEGHMVIDMFDTQNKQLIWRGISQGEVNNNPSKERQTIYQDIYKLFYSFPPKSK